MGGARLVGRLCEYRISGGPNFFSVLAINSRKAGGRTNVADTSVILLP